MASAAAAGHGLARLMELESTKCNISAKLISYRQSVHLRRHTRYHPSCSLSMNGCQGDPKLPIGIIETRTFPAVASPALAMDTLNSAVREWKANPPFYTSGIIRLQGKY
uniref:Isochorismate synthase 2ic n=1 Tax=Rhizophora mucronata TaxID=61149 RepID=A0A2P2L177_RHIMU